MLVLHETEKQQFTRDGRPLRDISELGAVRPARKRSLVKALQLKAPMAIEYADGHTSAGGPGDWLVQGEEGEVYFIKAEIFDASYEFVGS